MSVIQVPQIVIQFQMEEAVSRGRVVFGSHFIKILPFYSSLLQITSQKSRFPKLKPYQFYRRGCLVHHEIVYSRKCNWPCTTVFVERLASPDTLCLQMSSCYSKASDPASSPNSCHLHCYLRFKTSLLQLNSLIWLYSFMFSFLQWVYSFYCTL